MEKERQGRGTSKEAAAGMEWEKTVSDLRRGTHGVRLEEARGGGVPLCAGLHKLSWVVGTSPKVESGKQK